MRRPLIVAVALLLAACVPVETRYWDDTPRKLRPGDVVRIETTAGKQHVFHINRVDDAAFYGMAKNQIEYRVPFKVVRQLWVRTTETEWQELHFGRVCCGIFL